MRIDYPEEMTETVCRLGFDGCDSSALQYITTTPLDGTQK